MFEIRDRRDRKHAAGAIGVPASCHSEPNNGNEDDERTGLLRNER